MAAGHVARPLLRFVCRTANAGTAATAVPVIAGGIAACRGR